MYDATKRISVVHEANSLSIIWLPNSASRTLCPTNKPKEVSGNAEYEICPHQYVSSNAYS